MRYQGRSRRRSVYPREEGPYLHAATGSTEEGGVIANHLRLQPGQQALTSEQEAEARHFANARIAAQLSTELVETLFCHKQI